MLKVNGILIEQNHFPDNSLLVKFSPYGIENPLHISIEWKYENDSELFTLICLKRHLEQSLPFNMSLKMAYIPHARQDRVKNSEDIFTLKYFCEIINSLKFNTVYVLDAHSNVSLALLNNVEQMPIQRHIVNASTESRAEVLFFPDEGAMKRYSAASLLPFAFGMKRRDWESGQILGLDIINAEVIKDKNVLIVDDICCRGGTFYHSAKALHAAGAKEVNLYITHCENTIIEGELFTSNLVNKIYTTDSLVHTPEVSTKVNYV